jgi:hypothetical protein
MVKKYRDVIRMTLFGRHDKNINDATSIYQGYDRYATTTTGGSVNAITVSNNGTVGFATAPNVYISNATNTNVTALTSTLTKTIASAPVYALTITAGGTGFTGNPTLLFYGGGAPTTTATGIGWTGGGAMVIVANITTGLLTSFTITTSPFFTTSPGRLF